MRKYAAFFEWRDKCQKELGIVEELIVTLNAISNLGLHSPLSFSPDPPDCICLNASGQRVALEVAEVVCEEATRRNAQGDAVYREWRRGELTAHVAEKLTEKDQKTFRGGPYGSIICCLFTDEPALEFDVARQELHAARFGPFSNLTAAYLLFSYQPATQSYPAIELRLHQ